MVTDSCVQSARTWNHVLQRRNLEGALPEPLISRAEMAVCRPCYQCRQAAAGVVMEQELGEMQSVYRQLVVGKMPFDHPAVGQVLRGQFGANFAPLLTSLKRKKYEDGGDWS